jgi:pimeloyl-ACP methyl ester carboxylesterase
MRTVAKITATLTIFVIFVGLSAVAYRAYRQMEIGETLKIRTSHGIDEAMFVKIGGIDQWVQIRGENTNNPVLLVLHGGPGSSLMAYTPLFREWERHFTVVQWDQRGDGKTYGKNDLPSSQAMTIERMTKDGLELSDYLKNRLHKEKIILLGHSWGSVLGVGMAKAKPQWFSAFVGTGFIVSEGPDWRAAFPMLIQKARATNNQAAVTELISIGPPPYRDRRALKIHDQRKHRLDTEAEKNLFGLVLQTVIEAPNYSLIDIYNFFASARYSDRITYDELYAYDVRQRGRTFEIPVIIIEGAADLVTPASFIKKYFDWIQAPAKSFVMIEGGGHNVMLTMPHVFLQSLLQQVGSMSEPLSIPK